MERLTGGIFTASDKSQIFCNRITVLGNRVSKRVKHCICWEVSVEEEVKLGKPWHGDWVPVSKTRVESWLAGNRDDAAMRVIIAGKLQE